MGDFPRMAAGRIGDRVVDAQMPLDATAYPCGAGHPRSAVVQAGQPLSSYRPGHLTRSRRLLVDGLEPFPGLRHAPSGFTRVMTPFQPRPAKFFWR